MTQVLDEQFKARLRDTSSSFRKKEGRHTLKSKGFIYCAFETDRFSVTREEAQRSAPRRLARFGLGAPDFAGRSALDLGCFCGSMLLQAAQMGLQRGLGLEYDSEKVELAKEIASHCGFDHLRFAQADIDGLEASELGTFDIVFALAIEAHVLDSARLYRLLGEVTGELLCFEGNGNCDTEAVEASLLAVGFSSVDHIGFCDDDIVPANNKRPMMLARK